MKARKKISVTLVIGALCLGMLLLNSGFAEEVKVLKLGLAMSPKGWGYNYAPHEVFKEIVESRTHGKVIVELYPNNQLGRAPTLLKSVRKGIAEAACPSTGKLEPFFSKVNLLSIPYLFKNEQVAWRVLDGPFGKEWGEALRKESGLRLLNLLENGGFTDFVTTEVPVHSAADLEGLKLRVEPVPAMMTLVKSVGASPVSITWAEMYTSLQTGVVDGFDENLVAVYDFNLHEVVKYAVRDRHTYESLAFVINDKWFSELTPEQQSIIQEAADVAQMVNRSICRRKENLVVEKLTKAGLEVYYPTDEEITQFREATQEPVTAHVAGIEGVGQEWIDKLLGAIDQAEKETGIR